MRVIAVATLVVAVGASCGDERNYTIVGSLDECHRGYYFAECGDGDGDGEPVLGCDGEGYTSRWFANATVPREIEMVSACPADEICCVDNWPFPRNSDSAGDQGYSMFYAVGLEPWDRDRDMNVDVVIDPSLTPPASPSLACTGPLDGDPEGGPCGDVGGVGAFDLDTPAIAIYGTPDFYGWDPMIELDESENGELRARVCIHSWTDVIFYQCPDRVAYCATSGTITIERWPLSGATAFHLDVGFEDGSTMVGDGATPQP